MSEVINELQDLTYLKWEKIRHSSGTAGSFLKSQEIVKGTKYYYKLSNYNEIDGIVGHESVNELIVARLLNYLGIEHLDYDLVHAKVVVDDREHETYFSSSKDFKKLGDSKNTFETYYELEKLKGETVIEFCRRKGWKKKIDEMMLIDFLVLNRDRHGANIEVLKSREEKTVRLAPLFDQGLSLLFNCHNDKEIMDVDVLEDKPVQSFFGGNSTFENLKLMEKENLIPVPFFDENLHKKLYEGLETVVSSIWIDTTWKMLVERRGVYEDFRNSR